MLTSGSSDDRSARIKLRSERTDIRADVSDRLPGFEHFRLRLASTDYRHDEVDGPALFNRCTNEVEDGRITAADARFRRIDGQASLRSNDRHRLTVFGDPVRAERLSEDDHVPRTPPGRLGVRHAWASGHFSADAEYYRTAAQDRIASYETTTKGYDMLNASIASRLALTPRQSAEFCLRATKLVNETAYVHSSFIKDQSPMRGRSVVLGIRCTS